MTANEGDLKELLGSCTVTKDEVRRWFYEKHDFSTPRPEDLLCGAFCMASEAGLVVPLAYTYDTATETFAVTEYRGELPGPGNVLYASRATAFRFPEK